MFGKNKTLPATYGEKSKASAEEKAGEVLEVNSIFYTIQGEGPYAGQPAVFVRLTGCNLKCWFCDTEFETGDMRNVDSVVATVRELAGKVCDLVVLTGGEPMRQQITRLCEILIGEEFTVQIETAGTLWPEGDLENLVGRGGVSIVCSPKTPKVHELVERHCHHYKYIMQEYDSAKDGLPSRSTQVQGKSARVFRPSDPAAVIWVQPCFEYDREHADDVSSNRANMIKCVDTAKQHGYRVSLQQHKIMGVE